MMRKTTIIICDDHQILVQGLKSLLKDHEEIEVIATANNGEELLQILQSKTPDIILLDVEMPLMDGLETLKHIKKSNHSIKVLFLTLHSDKDTIKKIMDHGAQGYVLKTAGKNELLEAIRKAKNGQIYMSDKATQILIEKEKLEALSAKSDNKIEKLTHREIEILKLITEGYSNTEIGSMLYISPRTVDTHRTNIMKKLNVKNIAGLIKYAIQNGI